jgi:hypothetical protein
MAMMALRGLLGLAANAMLLLGSYWTARFGYRQSRRLNVGLATAVVFWFACTIGLEILGSFGAIALGPMFAWGMVVVAIGAGCRIARGKIPDSPQPHAADGPFSWDAIVCLSLLLSAAIILGVRSLLLGVKVVSDGPIYHLYFAARWWKAGRLFLVASPFGENAATYFPANGDLWFTWLMASWGGDRLAKVGQVPFLSLGAAAAYGCARRVGAGRSSSVVAMCWFASSTPFLLFSFEPNVDTIFVAGYIVAAYFFLQAYDGDGDPGACWLGAMAAGAALGTKAVGVVFVPPLLAVALLAILIKPVPIRTKAQCTLAIVLGTLASGGFWYCQNLLLTGNPVYPLAVKLLGYRLFPGWYLADAMKTSQYYLPIANWRALGDTLLAVLDPRLAPFWAAALLAGPAIAREQTDSTRRLIAVFASMAVVNVVLYWVFIPYRTQQRFMLQALALAVVPLAVTLDCSRWLRSFGALLAALHLLSPQGWPIAPTDGSLPWDLSPLIPNAVSSPIPLFERIGKAFTSGRINGSTLGLMLLIGLVLSSVVVLAAICSDWSHTLRARVRRTIIGLAGLVAIGLGCADATRDLIDPRLRFYPLFADFFAGWLQLEARSGTAGVRVAYAGTNIPYYLMAIGLRNDVRYVNVDEHRDWLMHDYYREAMKQGLGFWPNSRPGWDRMSADFQAWVDNLDAAGIQFLVVTRVNPSEGPHNVEDAGNFPIERRWADSHPEWFEPLYGQRENDPCFRLYRFRRRHSGRVHALSLENGRGLRL